MHKNIRFKAAYNRWQPWQPTRNPTCGVPHASKSSFFLKKKKTHASKSWCNRTNTRSTPTVVLLVCELNSKYSWAWLQCHLKSTNDMNFFLELIIILVRKKNRPGILVVVHYSSQPLSLPKYISVYNSLHSFILMMKKRDFS